MEMVGFMKNRTNNVAFVWDEAMASVHVMMSSEYLDVDDDSPPLRLAKEPLCKSKKILNFSHILQMHPFRLWLLITFTTNWVSL